jgi:hypothetical protein
MKGVSDIAARADSGIWLIGEMATPAADVRFSRGKEDVRLEIRDVAF